MRYGNGITSEASTKTEKIDADKTREESAKEFPHLFFDRPKRGRIGAILDDIVENVEKTGE